jgi:hypothetical protein
MVEETPQGTALRVGNRFREQVTFEMGLDPVFLGRERGRKGWVSIKGNRLLKRPNL